MRLRSIPVVVGTMLIAAHGVVNAAQRSDRMDALRQMATDVGRAVGAASVCREISWPRIKALTDRFSDLIQASAANGEEFSSLQQSYDQSTTDSQLAVSSKRTDCVAAVRDLADLERAVTSPLPAATDTGASPANARAASVVPTPMTTGAAPPPDPRRRGR
jgi:branched-chain amino acid transport system substrate-binding protein